MKKWKLRKIILMISLLPYAFLLLKALYYAIRGYDVYTWIKPVYVGTIYGMEAFTQVLFWDVLTLCIIPVLPVCLLYQVITCLCYIIRKKKKERNDKG